ncbi:MAG: M17 family peptidase N-terminal domain-containing protein [Myxococcota bacterium]
MTTKTVSNPKRQIPYRVGDLAGLDELTEQSLALFLCSDVRPLRGVAGFIDWRLCGALSHTLESGDFTGEAGEIMLLPIAGRLGPRVAFVFGLGAIREKSASDRRDDLTTALTTITQVAKRAGVKKLSLVAPALPEDPEFEQDFLDLVQHVCASSNLVESVLVQSESL